MHKEMMPMIISNTLISASIFMFFSLMLDIVYRKLIPEKDNICDEVVASALFVGTFGLFNGTNKSNKSKYVQCIICIISLLLLSFYAQTLKF